MGNKRMIFIGNLNLGEIPRCGETVKNQYLYDFLRNELHFGLFTVDTNAWKRRPVIWCKLLYVLLFCRKAGIVLSVCNHSAYRLLKLLSIFRHDQPVYYFVIGGNLGKELSAGRYGIAPYKNAAAIYVEGHCMCDELQALGLNNVRYLPNFKRIEYYPPRSVPEPDTTKFVFLSRIIPEKGTGLIIESVKRLNEKGLSGRFSVHFYGVIEKKYEPEFRTAIAGCGNIAYKGFLNLREKPGWDSLAGYDMCLFPTFWKSEGFPGIIIDSYIAGLPVIASDWNCNAELICPEETGLIIRANDAGALQTAMEKAIRREYDLESMKKRCQREARHYNISEVLSSALFEK